MYQLTGLSKSLLKFGVNAVCEYSTKNNRQLEKMGLPFDPGDDCALCRGSNPKNAHIIGLNGFIVLFYLNLLILCRQGKILTDPAVFRLNENGFKVFVICPERSEYLLLFQTRKSCFQ
jgi:hypothetical protein